MKKMYSKELTNKTARMLELEKEIISITSEYIKLLINIGMQYRENLLHVGIFHPIKAILKTIMVFTGGNQVQSAKMLGISRGTLVGYLKKYFGSVDIGKI